MQHGTQLEDYSVFAEEYCKTKGFFKVLIYFKMEEQGDYREVEGAKYAIINRSKFLTLLESKDEFDISKQTNNILLDYYEDLKHLDQEVKSYKTSKEWTAYAWKGFFTELQQKNGLGTGTWSYVANKSGGFIGYQWNGKSKVKDGIHFDYYLQLEQDKLCFKIHVTSELETRKAVRGYFRYHLYKISEAKKMNLIQHGKIGKYMSVARLKEDYRVFDKNGLIDMKQTLANLIKYQDLLNAVEKEMKNE